MVTKELCAKVVKHYEEQIPGFKIVQKKDSALMKFLNVILFFVKGFMTKYYTALGTTVYQPEGKQITDKSTPYECIGFCEVMCHECQHLRDIKKFGILYNLMYIFPQNLAIFALLGFVNLWFLLFLLCLLPLPAPGRMYLEFRAYRISLIARCIMTKGLPQFDWLESHFTGMDYYFMWPFKRSLAKRFVEVYTDLTTNKADVDMAEMKELLK